MRSSLASSGLTLALVLVLHSFLPAAAQSSAALSGTVVDAGGHPIAGAAVTAKNNTTGASFAAQSGADGSYTFPQLAPGSYTVTVSAPGFAAQSASVTIASTPQTLALTLTALPEAPSAPAAAPQSPSLNDLGFSSTETQADPHLQSMLERRTAMLRMHQRLGLITTIPMAAALITGPMAKAKGRNGETITEPTSANLDFHIALGGATTALYWTTAGYAIFAPRIPGNPKHGAIRWHEALAWVHGTGMIATPVLGMMAYKQENAGERVHGIASAHGSVAWITAISYGTAMVAVSWPIHIKF